MAQNELKLAKNDLKTTPGGSRRLPNRPPAAPEKKHAKRGGRGRSHLRSPDAPRGSFGVQNAPKKHKNLLKIEKIQKNREKLKKKKTKKVISLKNATPPMRKHLF